MKKTILLLAAGCWLLASASATPVLFPLRTITGNPNLSRAMIVPDAWLNPQTDGTNLYGGFPLTISGLDVTTNLQPGGYTLVVPGWSKTKHFNVNAGSSPVSVINCMTNVASWTNINSWNGGGNGSTSAFSGTVTNLFSSISVTPNYSYSTNNGYLVVGAGASEINGSFILSASLSFTNSTGGTLFWNSGQNYWQINGGYSFYVGCNGGTNCGTTNSAAGLTWFVSAGTPPAPTVSAALIITTNLVGYVTNAVPRYNLTTFTNGVCVTNVFQ